MTAIERCKAEIPISVSYGAGINSTAMLIGMYERGIIPDLIPFADVGKWLEAPAEWPETYRFIDVFSEWLVKHSMPAVTVVRHKSDTLYESCIRNGTLPSKAYGFPGCAVKFKHQIIEGYEAQFFSEPKPVSPIYKAIGYHAGEDRGSGITEKCRYRYRYFLKEWGWHQSHCIAAIERHGMKVPRKSSCWFCPSMKPHEIRELAITHPLLMKKAIAMEHNAKPYHDVRGGHIKGLCRTYSFEQVVQASEAQFHMFPEPDKMPCTCFDGEAG